MNSSIAWLSGTINGPVATAVCVLSIAVLGLGMLHGRIDIRRGAFTVVGCFILFSSRTIAAALLGTTSMLQDQTVVAPAPARPAYKASIPPPVEYDPYAGASVPMPAQNSEHDLLPR
jgi:hypothetical protein